MDTPSFFWSIDGVVHLAKLRIFWGTVPYLARDQRRVEDVDSSGVDHAADACRYGILFERPLMGLVEVEMGDVATFRQDVLPRVYRVRGENGDLSLVF